MRNAKKKFESKLAKDVKNNPKAFYKYINSKKSSRDSIGPLKVNGKLVESDSEIADKLNSFFSSVFTRDEIDCDLNLQCVKEGIVKLEDIEISPSAVKKKLDKLKPFSAPGPDGLSPYLLKELSNELSLPLSIVFQKSLSENSVPTDWKVANITPIFKKGSKFECGNYRPVSLTSVICRVMEGVIRDSIVDHLSSNDLLLPSQHGFVRKRSCLTNLLEYFEKITALVDQGECVDILYLDFSKAFDKVSHIKLSALLNAHGICGKIKDWIDTWLSERRQRVVLNGNSSEWLPVTSGVPQGSVLGPTLFVIFINLLDTYLSDYPVIVSKFADDSKVGMVVNDEADAVILQKVVNLLCTWSDDFSMEFNAKKCKVMHLGRKNITSTYTMNGYAPAGTVLQQTEEEKDVGVLISNSLKPAAQCRAAARKAHQLVGQAARAFSYRDKNNWIRIYKTYIRPHLEYVVQVWSPWHQKDIDALEDIQKRVLRMTSGLSSTLYHEQLKELGMMSLFERRKRGDMIQVWKILHNHDDVDETIWFTRKRSDGVRTRLADCPFNLDLNTYNREIRQNFFSVRTVNVWNSLPDHIKEAKTLLAFKSLYDRHWTVQSEQT